MLENLVAKFEHPSILDLKMGTRTYGDDESNKKKDGKRRKAETSTTKSLGVRLHGMQVILSSVIIRRNKSVVFNPLHEVSSASFQFQIYYNYSKLLIGYTYTSQLYLCRSTMAQMVSLRR